MRGVEQIQLSEIVGGGWARTRNLAYAERLAAFASQRARQAAVVSPVDEPQSVGQTYEIRLEGV